MTNAQTFASHSRSRSRPALSQRRVSIKDIARVADVSYSTVSRALNNHPRISEATRDRIQRLAEEMGYTANAVAQSLQTRQTDTIGFVVTSLDDPFFPDIVKGAESVARTAELSVFLSVSYNEPEIEMQAIETFHRRRVDGILMASSRVGTSYVDRLARINVPVVLIQNEAEEGHDFLHSVVTDDRPGARLAVEHLVELGHERIGYLGVSDRRRSNSLRFEGYREALLEAGISPREAWTAIASLDLIQRDGDVAAGQMLGAQLLDAGVTAIFCYNDMTAVGVIRRCRERGEEVPERCSVVGFDDINLAQHIAPALTTVHVPKYEMGRTGMNMLLELLDDRSVDDRVLAPTLVERDSTAPA